MAYSDKSYFLKRIPASELNKLTDSDDANLASAINAADSLIDGYLRNQTAELPLDSPVPDIISQLSYDIAVFYLHDRIQYADVPDRVRDKYDAAINYLKDISSGKVQIGINEDEQKSNVEYGSNSPVMRRNMF